MGSKGTTGGISLSTTVSRDRKRQVNGKGQKYERREGTVEQGEGSRGAYGRKKKEGETQGQRGEATQSVYPAPIAIMFHPDVLSAIKLPPAILTSLMEMFPIFCFGLLPHSSAMWWPPTSLYLGSSFLCLWHCTLALPPTFTLSGIAPWLFRNL